MVTCTGEEIRVRTILNNYPHACRELCWLVVCEMWFHISPCRASCKCTSGFTEAVKKTINEFWGGLKRTRRCGVSKLTWPCQCLDKATTNLQTYEIGLGMVVGKFHFSVTSTEKNNNNNSQNGRFGSWKKVLFTKKKNATTYDGCGSQ